MKEIIAYELIYNKPLKYHECINCVPFQEKYWNEYMKIYNRNKKSSIFNAFIGEV